jgi:hypothetical protein
MSTDALIKGLPDLVVLIRRDGMVLDCGGGHGVPGLRPCRDFAGLQLEALWPPPVAQLLRQLTRKAIALRTTAQARFEEGGCAYEARVSAQGPERAICVLFAAAVPTADDLDSTDERPRPQLDRRGFLRRFKESISLAALREAPLAIALIEVDGITDIAQIIATKISEQIMSAAVRRLPAHAGDGERGKPWWYLGQLSESLLALVLESSDREAIEECSPGCAPVCASRSPSGCPVPSTPYAGVAVLGRDASSLSCCSTTPVPRPPKRDAAAPRRCASLPTRCACDRWRAWTSRASCAMPSRTATSVCATSGAMSWKASAW